MPKELAKMDVPGKMVKGGEEDGNLVAGGVA